MSSKKISASSDIYTGILAIILGVVAATAGLVAYKCYSDYETLFKIVDVFR